MIVTVWPATERVPVRGEALVFVATLEVTVPLPEPDDPEVIVIHEVDVEADHEQPVGAVTETVAVVAPEASDTVVGATLNVQGAPACVTVKVWPAMVRVPVRPLVELLAATV